MFTTNLERMNNQAIEHKDIEKIVIELLIKLLQ